MANRWTAFAAALSIAYPLTSAESPGAPENYVFFGRDRERIREASFLETEALVGAQLKYTWKELEPERDRYDLEPVLLDLEFLESHGKRLFIQLQDVSFGNRILVPDYLLADEFGGGVARKMEGESESELVFDGWVSRRWDPRVIERFKRLLGTLGAALDGRIEGLNLPETAIGWGTTRDYHPAGFSFEGYVEGVTSILMAAREAFPRSSVLLYANFMPGESLPREDNGYLRAVYEHAARIGAGVGGPDLLPHRQGQQDHSLKLIAERPTGVVAGLAVQDGNLADKNPQTGQPVTVGELYDYATRELRLDYIFWGTEEPYYTRDVIPFLRR